MSLRTRTRDPDSGAPQLRGLSMREDPDHRFCQPMTSARAASRAQGTGHGCPQHRTGGRAGPPWALGAGLLGSLRVCPHGETHSESSPDCGAQPGLRASPVGRWSWVVCEGVSLNHSHQSWLPQLCQAKEVLTVTGNWGNPSGTFDPFLLCLPLKSWPQAGPSPPSLLTHLPLPSPPSEEKATVEGLRPG